MNGELLKRIARSFLRGDEKEFLTAMQQIISAEKRQGHNKLAEDLTKILSNGHSNGHTTNKKQQDLEAVNSTSISVIKSQEKTSLIEVLQTEQYLDAITLVEETSNQIERFLKEYHHRDKLAEYGLKPKLKLLLYGPPGNGKTFCAKIIAAELSLPLFYVRFDSLITSYLGETSANLRHVFNFATSHKGVLLLDEFDAIGKSRSDPDEVGELKRVVSSLLQLLDNYSGSSPIIAATNYDDILDYALWRRFDSLIYFPPPTLPQIEQYLRHRLSAFSAKDFDLYLAAQLCLGLSYAEIARAFTDALKSMVLAGRKTLNIDIFQQEVNLFRQAYEHRSNRISSSDRGRHFG